MSSWTRVGGSEKLGMDEVQAEAVHLQQWRIGGRVSPTPRDVTDRPAVEPAVALIEAHLGPITLLFLHFLMTTAYSRFVMCVTNVDAPE